MIKRNDLVSIILDIIKIAIAVIMGFIIIKALLGAI